MRTVSRVFGYGLLFACLATLPVTASPVAALQVSAAESGGVAGAESGGVAGAESGGVAGAESGGVAHDLKKLGVERGIVVLLDVPVGGAERVVALAQAGKLTIYFQSADVKQVAAVREAADAAGLLGVKIFADAAPLSALRLADNIADGALVGPTAEKTASADEILRVLRPRAVAQLGDKQLLKPVPAGIDEWTHPYHGPDNNPQSNDQLVRGSFQTQFLADPKFSPMPEQSVIAGGRIFKAMGHIAHKSNQNPMLNTLLGINAYNGTILWKRPLPAGFMIHRNTMIATDDALYLGDDESCKVIDAASGEVRDQITIPKELTDGPVWKWMAMKNGVLYGLVGNPEIKVDTKKSARRGLGHWPWAMWKGHDYGDPRTAFGFGRTMVAIDVKTKKVLWHFRDKEYLDARGVCMFGDRIYCYSPERYLLCLDANDGLILWKNNDKDLMAAISPSGKAQHYVTGYATTCYIKCDADYLFFAGPQRPRLAVASAEDGKLAWTFPVGNLQLVLRKDAIYAAGPQRSTGMKLDYKTGKVLASFPARRACTRATGCADSIFYRASGGTVRVVTETNTAQHIAPMRPPCQDGVLISNGCLYWGPWMCGCQLSLYGNIALSPVGESRRSELARAGARLTPAKNASAVQPLAVRENDWPNYRGGNQRDDLTGGALPGEVKLAWTAKVSNGELPTAPVAAGGLVFVADRAGVVRAFDVQGEEVWKAYTSGPIYFPPTIAQDRLYVGSADGRVYAMEAATGRLLWSFRVAPVDRWVPVFGKLISTWPVAGGVVVENGTVYAAAGISHFDGTYVVALDALSGELQAENSTSGVLSEEVQGGISMQGNLAIVDGELRFLAGGVYETARYDLKTLKCLNEPKAVVNAQFRTAFYPFYPAYGKYVSLEHTLADGSTLCHDASYEGSVFNNLALESPLPAGASRPRKEASRWVQGRGRRQKPKIEWRDKKDRRFTSFIVSETQLLATGHVDQSPDDAFLAAINIKDGSQAWRIPIPADAVKGGAAIDHDGRIYVSLENGRLLCFSPAK